MADAGVPDAAPEHRSAGTADGRAPDAADERVAVVVIHGVADQREGETAQALVDLMVALGAHGTRYVALEEQRFTIAVPPLRPHAAARGGARAAREAGGAHTLRAAFQQSLRSDFHDASRHASASPDDDVPRGASVAAAAPHDPTPDRGIAVTDYLLDLSVRGGAGTETYRSRCLRLRRDAGAGPARVDVYEGYWADLSRLSGKLPRIVTELFSFVFRLSKLGRDTVQDAATHFAGDASRSRHHTPAAGAWPMLAFLQRWVDWLFVNGLALLFAQLGLVAAFIALLGLVRGDTTTVRWIAGAALTALGVLAFLYRRQRGARTRAGGAALLAIAGVALVLSGPYQALAVGVLLLAGLTIAFDLALRASEERFPFVRPVGLALWIATLAVVAWGAVQVSTPWAGARLRIWIGPALLAAEVALWTVKWWWILAPVWLTAWLLAGLRAQHRGGYEAAGSVGTGRLGVLVSFATFVMLVMALWALIEGVLEPAVRHVAYRATLFVDDPSIAPECLVPQPAGPPLISAGCFLRQRYEASTAFFAPVATVLLLIVFYLAAMMLPSVLAELGLASRARAGRHRHARRPRTPAAVLRLGRWLTAGYRRLDLATTAVAVVSIAATWVVARVLLDDRSMRAILAVSSGEFGVWARLFNLSKGALEPIVFSAATVAAALTLLGGVLSRYLPSLRAPLDIALDVDNYFREFPRRHIPRARIFSRFHALLDHVARQGYRRIVVVAHSQGTVIGAELLRWMSSAPGDGPATRTERLERRLGCEVRLLTLGCPLRQLYASRFPTLYRWVLASRRGANGPEAEDLGVRVWANAYTSGDYVGRWLWSSPAAAGDAVGHPMIDTVSPPQFGRADAYAPFDPMPPDARPLASARELEVCLGAGAHTHYFELDQSTVAWLVEQLVAAPRP